MHVRHAGELDRPAREEAVAVAVLRRHEAVRRHEDGAGELDELLVLVLPRGAEVPDQVLVLLELRVGVGRQHLAVRVDVDALAVGLLEQRREVGEVVAGDEDGLARALAERDLRRLRLAVGAGVGRVEDLHRAQVHLAALQGDADPLVEAERRVASAARARNRYASISASVWPRVRAWCA